MSDNKLIARLDKHIARVSDPTIKQLLTDCRLEIAHPVKTGTDDEIAELNRLGLRVDQQDTTIAEALGNMEEIQKTMHAIEDAAYHAIETTRQSPKGRLPSNVHRINDGGNAFSVKLGSDTHVIRSRACIDTHLARLMSATAVATVLEKEFQ